MKKKKNADVVETEAAEAVTEETKTSKDKKPETATVLGSFYHNFLSLYAISL